MALHRSSTGSPVEAPEKSGALARSVKSDTSGQEITFSVRGFLRSNPSVKDSL